MSEVIPIGGWVNFSAGGGGGGGSDKKTVSLDFRSPEVGISADCMGQVNFDLGQMGIEVWSPSQFHSQTGQG